MNSRTWLSWEGSLHAWRLVFDMAPSSPDGDGVRVTILPFSLLWIRIGNGLQGAFGSLSIKGDLILSGTQVMEMKLN